MKIAILLLALFGGIVMTIMTVARGAYGVLDHRLTAVATVIIALLILSGCSNVRPMLTASHTSDITRSMPEPTQEFIGAGVTIEFSHIEFDIAHGMKCIDCGFGEAGHWGWESGTDVAVRIYPFGE